MKPERKKVTVTKRMKAGKRVAAKILNLVVRKLFDNFN